MACVRRRRDKWVLDYRDQHGRRHWETVQGNRKDADGLLALRLHEVGRGNFEAKAEEKTFDEVMAAYKTGHVDVNVRPTTRKDYEALLELHVLPHFKGMKVRAIAPQTVEAWRNNLLAKGGGRRTGNKAHIQPRSCYRFATTDQRCDFLRCLVVRVVHQVPVHVHRDADRAVTHQRLDALRVHVLRDEERRERVAQVMEADPPELRAAQGRVEPRAQQDAVIQR